MEFIKDKKILVMTLVDLEHCGFDYEEFLGELFLNGIDDKEAEQPVMLMVNFSESHETTRQGVPDNVIRQVMAASELFDGYVEKVTGV